MRFAQTTGGQAFFPGSVKDLERMYDKILREIAGRYSIGYISTNSKMDGAWRDVKVRLVGKPQFEDTKIRTRTGYYAAYKPTSQK
jgi:Ca-activated chloride channel family protein